MSRRNNVNVISVHRFRDGRWGYVLVPRCWNGDLALVNAALVDPRRGGWTTSSESLGAAPLDPSGTRPWYLGSLQKTYVQDVHKLT
ncbi:jg10093 [Pararge aegeria aegeria]|uniref:Jg10093 protein n=1 Tax=Pararge aegeria aegeria TaxID=348720 RepID=A0A8S4SBB8_9NEOP|nr:jg10093 [Pararge aegeria aegeria]